MVSFPWLFLAFLAVPLLIHLFNFRRTRKLYFSTLRFINEVALETRSKTRLKHYLILLTRLFLFTSILVVLFLQVSTKGTTSFEGATIFVDHSISNQRKENGIDRLELIKAQLEDFAQELPDVRVNTLSADKIYRKNLNAMEWKSLDYVNTEESWYSLKEEKASDLNIIYSDFQSFEETLVNQIERDSTREYVLMVNEGSASFNVLVDSAIAFPSTEDYSKVRLAVSFLVQNIEATDANVVVKLFDEERQVASVLRKSSELSTLYFDLPVLSSLMAYRIQIEGDDTAYDNQFYFTILPSKILKIGAIAKESNPFVRSVFGNTFFFDFTSFKPDNVDFELLNQLDFLILDGLEELPTGLLSQYSGKVLVLPPTNIDQSNYQEQLGTSFVPQVDSTFYELVIEPSNPFFRGIFSKEQRNHGEVRQRPLYKFSGEFVSLLKLRSGSDFLIQKEKTYLLASPLDSEFGNLQVSPLFVPIMYRLANGEDYENIYYTYPMAKIAVDFDAREKPLTLINDNYNYLPAILTSGTTTVLEIPDEIPAAMYQIVHDADTLVSIGVNILKNESVKESPSVKQLRSKVESLENVRVYQLFNDFDISEVISEKELSYWKYALMLILLFVVIETLLHRYLK